MKCEHIQERLSEYLEGQLDSETVKAVQSHLASCSRCQAEAQTLAQAIQAVAGLPSAEPPAGFSQRVMARIREEDEIPRLWQRLFLPMRVKIPIHAVALILVAGFAVYLYRDNRPTILLEQRKMPESAPFQSAPESESMPSRKPQSAAGERQKETDAITPSASGEVGGLKRDEDIPQELLAKRKMSDLKSAEVAAAAAPDYELTLIFQKPFEEIEQLSPRLEVLVKKSGGEYLQPEPRADGLKQNSLREPQIIWLLIPENHYNSFKTGLFALGKIEPEKKTENAQSTPRSSAETSPMLRIKLTIRAAEKP